MPDLQPAPPADTPALLDKFGLSELMQESSGSSSVCIAVIDGPVDLQHPAFVNIDVHRSSSAHTCGRPQSKGCQHGTAVLGVLAAARGSGAPALCPGCSFMIQPVFGEAERSGPIAIETLASAVRSAVLAGADVVNLSLGLSNRARRLEGLEGLYAAYDLARQHGTLVVVAAGNFGHIGYTPLIDHPWVIPVAAATSEGRLHAASNAGQRVGRQGLLGPAATLSAAAGGAYAPFTGTSAAAPFVSGAAALLLSLHPRAPKALVRFALLGASHGRRSVIPPVLNAAAALRLLRKQTLETSNPRRVIHMSEVISTDKPAASASDLTSIVLSDNSSVVMSGGCGCNGGAEAAAKEEPPVYVYALGTVRAEWSSQSAQKEYDQVAADMRPPGGESRVLYEVLRKNHYLAREVCWIFAIEKQDVYRIVVRDSDLDSLIAAIEPHERDDDQELLVGTRGPVRTCGKFTLPMVLADRVVPFERHALFQQLEVPTGADAPQFRAQADELFTQVQQLVDNTGESDRDRAYNYLLTRYPQVYALTAQKQNQGMRFDGLEIHHSRLSDSGGKLVNVVLKFSDRRTEAPEKYYVRVDVSGKYPFLSSRLAPFYDR
jgi:hypothetical protein